MAEKADKGHKRKRLTDDSSKPSKKVAFEAEKGVKVSFYNADKWAPVIGMSFLLQTGQRDLDTHTDYL